MPLLKATSAFGLGTRCWSSPQQCYLHCLRNLTITINTHTHPFNGPLSGTTRVSRYQKRKTNLDFTEWQWHQLGHMQVCTSLQTDNHASTRPLSFYRPDALPAAQPTASKHWRHTITINTVTKTVTKQQTKPSRSNSHQRGLWQQDYQHRLPWVLSHHRLSLECSRSYQKTAISCPNTHNMANTTVHTYIHKGGGSVAEWLVCWTQAQKGPGSSNSRDVVGWLQSTGISSRTLRSVIEYGLSFTKIGFDSHFPEEYCISSCPPWFFPPTSGRLWTCALHLLWKDQKFSYSL